MGSGIDKVAFDAEFKRVYESAKRNDFKPMYAIIETHGVEWMCRAARCFAPSGYGLLHQATYFMDLDAMSYLIRYGASPDDTALNGVRPEDIFDAEPHYAGVADYADKILKAKALLERARCSDKKYAPPPNDSGLMPSCDPAKTFAIGVAPHTMHVYYGGKTVTIPEGAGYVQDEFGRACFKDDSTCALAYTEDTLPCYRRNN